MKRTWAIWGLAAACVGFGGCGGNSVIQGAVGLDLSQTALLFQAEFGQPFNQTLHVDVTNSGTGTLNFTAASDSPWLTVSPSSGTAPVMLGVAANLGGLGVGTQTGHITVTAAGAQGSPATITVTFVVATPAANSPFWAQWGANPQHGGMVSVAGQNAARQLADVVYDPFVSQEQSSSNGELLVHYQAPITDGNDVYFMTKSGTYNGPNSWSTQQWNEARYTWVSGTLTPVWSFASDWKPEPNGASLSGWEPVFHPVDAGGFIYVPGAGGTVWKVSQEFGAVVSHINPFSGMGVTAADTFVAGPLTADSAGNIYYNAIELAGGNTDPWQQDVQGAWLVKVAPDDSSKVLTFATLVPGAPAGSATTCPGQFGSGDMLPWPPSNAAVPSTVSCGSQRPGINIAPAVAPDGTVYTASRAQFDGMQAYLIAVKPDFSGAKWAASLQNLLHDGCGVIVPISGPANNTPNACRNGATVGVDPTTNAPGSGVIFDQGSSSPTALPDGSVVFGALTNYNAFRGHMFKFDAAGNFQGAYDFGWDSTPAVYTHGGTYSIVLKDNHYGTELYCRSASSICQPLPDGPFYITQLDPGLHVEWQFQSTNTQSCSRGASGTLNCQSTNPNGFEWCINMPAVDANGNVYVTSEDGNLYVLPQGNSGIFTAASANLFLNLAEGAAYTPLSIGPDGKLYTQNDGHLFVVGN